MKLILGLLNRIFGPRRPEPTPQPVPVPTPTPTTDDYEKILLDLHNTKRGSNPLKPDSKLTLAALKHAQWMAAHRRLDHWEGSVSVMGRANEVGYNSSYVGENIGMGYTTPQAAFDGWVKSSGHLQNIMNMNYRDVGFGMTKDASGVPYWCAVFGSTQF